MRNFKQQNLNEFYFILFGSITMTSFLTILDLSQSILTLALFIWVLIQYLNHKNRSILYLVITLFLLNLGGLLYYLFPESFIDSIGWTLLSSIQVLSLYFLLLFLDSFETNQILTRNNLILGIIVTSYISMLVVITPLVITIVLSYSNLNANADDLWEKTFESVIVSELGVILIFLSLLVITGLLILLLTIILMFKAVKKVKNVKNPKIKKMLKRMMIALVFVTVIPFILGAITEETILSSLSLTIGLGLFFFFFWKAGIFVLQSESLNLLLIVDESGIPVYSYYFKEYTTDYEHISKHDGTDQEILFSGALKAISTLLSEFTGAKKEVKEIVLDNMTLLVKQIDNFSIVLITDKVTEFFEDALEAFSLNVQEVFTHIIVETGMNSQQKEKTEKLVEIHFGTNRSK